MTWSDDLWRFACGDVFMKDASLSSDYHPGSVESDRESVAGKRGDRLTAPLLNCTLLSIAKHIRLYSLLFLSASVYCRVDGGVYSVHSKEPLSMSSQLDGTWYVSPTAAALSICVSSRAPAVMSQLSEHPCSRPRPPRHLIFSLDILHQNIVTALQHYKRNNPFINNQGSRNSHLMWNVWNV